MNILAIGNSFSEDATAYLHAFAAADGTALTVVNLYIGGCPLSLHAENIQKDAPAYEYQYNGDVHTGCKVSIREALREREWDVVVTQQVSGLSGIAESYFPALQTVVDFVNRHAPQAEIRIQQTWSYAADSTHPDFARYDRDQMQMYRALSAAYDAAAGRIGAALIPTGALIQTLRADPLFAGESLCRDGFHLDLTYGRFAAAANWYKMLCDKAISGNTFRPIESVDATAEARFKRILEIIDKR